MKSEKVGALPNSARCAVFLQVPVSPWWVAAPFLAGAQGPSSKRSKPLAPFLMLTSEGKGWSTAGK